MNASNLNQTSSPSPMMGLSQQDLEKRTRLLSLVTAFACLVFAVGFCIAGFASNQLQPFMMAGLMVVCFITTYICRNDRIISSQYTRAMIISVLMHLTLLCYSLLFQAVSLITAACMLMFAFVISTTVMREEKANTTVVLGIIFASLASLLGVIKPISQVDIGVFRWFGLVGLIFAMVFFALLYLRNSITIYFRIRLILAALFIVIIPTSLFSIISNRVLKQIQQAETNATLSNSAQILADQVDAFIQGNRASLSSLALQPIFSEYLFLGKYKRADTQEEEKVAAAMAAFNASLDVKERAFFTSLALLDMNGQVTYTTNTFDIGWNEKETLYFSEPVQLGYSYASDVIFFPADNTPYIVFSAPIHDENSNIIGILRAKYKASILQNLAKEYSGTLSESTYPIMFDQDYLRLAQPYRPQLLYYSLIPLKAERLQQLIAEGRKPRELHSTNFNDIAVFLDHSKDEPYYTGLSESDRRDQMAAVKLASKPWYVVFVQDESVLLKQLQQQTDTAVSIATILAALVSLAALVLSRSISNPIGMLTRSAQEISSGNLNVQIKRSDLPEFNLLGQTFENMGRQIQHMITSLEDRVAERTQALERQNDALVLRARQFETVAEVARSVVSTNDLEELLHTVTVLVSERFGFYHVGIFLIDKVNGYAVLRAANSEGGQRMLARQHRLQVGQTGIVGFVTSAGEPRIATDVGQDAVFFNNPDLPLTRSEMALPLKVNELVIGALDVQSTQSDAFSEEDIQLFTILADQVAVAIYNNNLNADMAAALVEAQNVHKRYLQQEWNRESTSGAHTAYRFTSGQIVPQPSLDAPDVQSAVEFGEPVTVQENGAHVLTVPVKLRGETIAVIRVQDSSDDVESWHPEEVETVKEVADQVALALENARLFEQTARRAERERKVLEITSKIRQHNDPQAMLEVAVQELQSALKASRAQVVLQPRLSAAAIGGHGGSGSNGNGNGHHHDEPAGNA